MRFFTVRDLRSSPRQVWNTLDIEKEVVITNNGKPSALMIPIDDTNFDEVLSSLRQVYAARAISRMHMAAAKAGLHTMSLDEINAEILLARREYVERRQDVASCEDASARRERAGRRQTPQDAKRVAFCESSSAPRAAHSRSDE